MKQAKNSEFMNKPREPGRSVHVSKGEAKCSNDASVRVVTSPLGSGLGITLYDPVHRVGGVWHSILPDSTLTQGAARDRKLLFSDIGLPCFLQRMAELGAETPNLILKIGGGANLTGSAAPFNIGDRNYAAFSASLAQVNLAIAAQCVGGHDSRSLTLDIRDGSVAVETPGRKPRLL